MIVSASTECYPDLSLQEVLVRLVDLEFVNVEIAIHEQGNHLQPSLVASNLERAVDICRNTNRLNVASYDQFAACCKLAKATKVVSVTVPSCEIGTPFNEEVEHLRRQVDIASVEGVLVSMKSQTGRLSQDPDTVVVLCDNVKGLGLTLDPSHYICGPHAGRSIDQIMKYVYHVQLRDTSSDELQVRVGQGKVEYGRLINQLRKVKFDAALSVHIREMDDVDHLAEMRKMRLLLESLL